MGEPAAATNHPVPAVHPDWYDRGEGSPADRTYDPGVKRHLPGPSRISSSTSPVRNRPDRPADRHVTRELRSLLAMSTDLARIADTGPIGDLVAEHLALATDVDECCVSYWDRSADRVLTYGYFPPERREAVSEAYPLADFPATRRVLTSREPTVVDVADPAADPSEVAYLRSIGNQTALLLPLVANGETIGLVELTSARPIQFDELRLDVAQAMANETAMAIENARLYEVLRHQAFHDPLTGLPNRALFKDRLEHAIARSIRGLRTVGVIFIDLDDFKTVNDSLGHAAGDEALVLAAGRLLSCVRPGDTVARLGGDEFAILVEDVPDRLEAEHLADRILDGLKAPLVVNATELLTGGSAGIALGSGGERTADELLRNADFAMYQAKTIGKGTYQVFQPSMRAAALERLALVGRLRHALDRQELVLHYQPIVDLRTGAVRGMEALVRWRDPERGLLLPGDFVPLAEETGLIIPIGRWVLREACHQARAWQVRFATDPPLSVSVNVSVKQFGHPDFVEEVSAALAEVAMDPATLTLELTESMLMQNTDATLDRLQALKAIGVRLAIDDFGTGYSSLSYLQRFPIDVLKIDRSFIEGIGMGAEATALVRSIIEIGQSLRLETVAEGVERAEQPSTLAELNCDLAQGYFLNLPQSADQIDRLLAGGRATR